MTLFFLLPPPSGDSAFSSDLPSSLDLLERVPETSLCLLKAFYYENLTGLAASLRSGVVVLDFSVPLITFEEKVVKVLFIRACCWEGCWEAGILGLTLEEFGS